MAGASRWRAWLVTWLVATVLFSNHLARDAPATAEHALASELGITSRQFAALTAAYFAPAVVSPLVAGVMAKRLGALRVWLGGALMLVAGHACAAAGALMTPASWSGILAGRVIAGTAYEVVDMQFIAFLGPLHEGGTWGTAAGIVNGLGRLGSVCMFAAAPSVIAMAGARGVFVAALAAIVVGFALAAAATFFAEEPTSEDSEGDSSDVELSCSRSDSTTAAHVETQKLLSSASSASLASQPETLLDELRALSRPRFLLYISSACALYASIVPFWFFGAHLLQARSGMSSSAADRLMVVPEGMICFFSMPVGLAVDKLHLTFSQRMRAFSAAAASLAGAYIMFNSLPSLPVLSVLLLGACYSTANTLFWSSFTEAIGKREHLALGTGIAAAFVNVGACVVPGVVGGLRAHLPQDEADECTVAALATSAILTAALAALTARTAERDELRCGE